MSKLDSASRAKPPKQVDLKAQAHNQVMDYLRLAAESKNPAFVDAVTQIAKEHQKQSQRVDAKITPTVAVIFATVIGIGAVWSSWYALVHYPGRLGIEIVTIITSLAVLLICLYALFSGHLSQGNFMVVFRWAADRLKKINPFGSRIESASTIMANDDEAEPPV